MTLEVPWALKSENEQDALALLREYFGQPGIPYTGASFETLGHNWNDPASINTITASDVLALATLSVEVKSSAAIALLSGDFQAKATALLTEIPADVSIADGRAAELFAGSSALFELWRLVNSRTSGIATMGRTRTSKLLARKRPLLVPIYDSLVDQALLLKKRDQWIPLRELLTVDGNALYSYAESLHSEAGLSDLVTPLRTVDVCLWMSVKKGLVH